MIRKEAWPFYRTISGVRLGWELEEPKGPTGPILATTPGERREALQCSHREDCYGHLVRWPSPTRLALEVGISILRGVKLHVEQLYLHAA